MIRPLTDTEVKVLRLVAKGESNAGIAEGLGMSVQTVKNHMMMLMTKLKARNRTHAVYIARRFGIIR